MQGLADKNISFIESLLEAANDKDFQESVEKARAEWTESAQRIYANSPSDLERKLTEGEEAFSLLYKIRKLLSLEEPVVEQQDWMLKAREEFREKKYDAALKSFQMAIANCFPSTDDLVLAGTCALYAGRLDHANSYADQALRLDETEIQALVLKSLVLYRREDYKEAYAYLIRAKTIREDHPAVKKYLPLVEKAMSAPFQASSKENEARLKRRWVRKKVSYDLVVNDYEQLSAMSVKVRSLSAGGCLVDPSSLPDQFDFILEFDGSGRVAGTAKKIYQTGFKQVGLKFLNLSPKDEDLINQRLAAIHA